MMNQLEDMLVDVEADPTLSRTGTAIKLLVRTRAVEAAASKPLPCRAGLLKWDGLSELAAECFILRRRRVKRILGFTEPWFRALQYEDECQRQMRSDDGP